MNLQRNLDHNLLSKMTTAKITEITKVNEWKWPNGTIYYINMKLDNDEQISLGKKKADAFKVGDTVNYESFEENGKTKYKEIKEYPFKPRAYSWEWNNKGAMVWMAIKTAFEVFYDAKKENFKETMALAYRIYEEAMAMFNEGEEKESAKDDKLPF